ncbi:hypothetical protein K504DRAFT_456515 [Pleomassaria siparia CBS 279.74]|uniref:Uncharacterized protein n=1 Tax=Pleomassaria siparia CBS 279.74 TaxID=1314801 RepID=A0A6G1K7S7_9PLEO|nr:hypothetical protein K504DRAFT_456515 [Pleomassaria siparia CBS 279.74]
MAKRKRVWRDRQARRRTRQRREVKGRAFEPKRLELLDKSISGFQESAALKATGARATLDRGDELLCDISQMRVVENPDDGHGARSRMIVERSAEDRGTTARDFHKENKRGDGRNGLSGGSSQHHHMTWDIICRQREGFESRRFRVWCWQESFHDGVRHGTTIHMQGFGGQRSRVTVEWTALHVQLRRGRSTDVGVMWYLIRAEIARRVGGGRRWTEGFWMLNDSCTKSGAALEKQHHNAHKPPVGKISRVEHDVHGYVPQHVCRNRARVHASATSGVGRAGYKNGHIRHFLDDLNTSSACDRHTHLHSTVQSM